MGTFGILGQLAGGYAEAADEAHERKRGESRAMRMGLTQSLAGMLDDPNISAEAKNYIASELFRAWQDPSKPFKFDPNKIPQGAGGAVQVPIGAGGGASLAPTVLPPGVAPPPGPTPGFPAEVAAPSGGLPMPPTAQEPTGVPDIYLSQDEILRREVERARAISEATTAGRVAATPAAPPKLQRVTIADPSAPDQSIVGSYNPATGVVTDASGTVIETPRVPTKHTPYLDFRAGEVAKGTEPGMIPKLWNQQQIQLERENPSGMGLVISGVDTETNEPVFRWISPEERRRGVTPGAVVTTRPRLGGDEREKRRDFLIQTIVRNHTGSPERLYRTIGQALNPELSRDEALTAGKKEYTQWLSGGQGTLPPPPGETGAPTSPTTSKEYLEKFRKRKPKK